MMTDNIVRHHLYFYFYDLVVTHVDQAIDSFDPVKFLENGLLEKYRLGIRYLSYGPTREDVISYF